MSKRKRHVERAIESIDQEIAVLQLARRKLVDQMMEPEKAKPQKRPRVVSGGLPRAQTAAIVE